MACQAGRAIQFNIAITRAIFPSATPRRWLDCGSGSKRIGGSYNTWPGDRAARAAVQTGTY
jgi:hypothetical protein